MQLKQKNKMKASIEFIAPVSPYKKVNGSDVDFTTACVIVDSWTMVKRVKNWENVLGAVFLQKYVILVKNSPSILLSLCA